MSECPHCQATDDPENGIVVGLTGHGGSSCTICRADELHERTTLSKQEAKVAAHKQITGATHETIAERIGIEKSTVDEYSRRMKSKAKIAAITHDELSEFV